MPINMIVTPEAYHDIDDAYWWYEERQIGLGEKFFSYLNVCLQNIEQHPNLYPIVYKSYHRALVQRFPYAVFYEQTQQHISVYAIFHTAQIPSKWRKRLSHES